MSPIDVTRTETTWGESFEPDVLAGEEFAGWFRPQTPPQGERLLLLAVLEEGITCYQRYAGVASAEARRLFADASAWLESTDRSHLFAFESICDTLELSADDVRRRLWAWRARRLARAALNLRPVPARLPAADAALHASPAAGAAQASRAARAGAPPTPPRRRPAAPATRRTRRAARPVRRPWTGSRARSRG
jgi:hypothetical protein